MLLPVFSAIALVALGIVYTKSDRYYYEHDADAFFPAEHGYYYRSGDYEQQLTLYASDESGIQMIDYGAPTGRQYNPIAMTSSILKVVDEREKPNVRDYIRRHLDFLIESSESTAEGNHVFVYEFDYEPKGERAPWYSAVAQGRVASAMMWGYRIFNDDRYRDTGIQAALALTENNNIYRFRKELQNGIWLKKYPSSSISNLDGMLEALAGIYDVYQSLPNDSSERASLGKFLDLSLVGLKSNVDSYSSVVSGHLFTDDGVLPAPDYHHDNIAFLNYLTSYEPGLEQLAEKFAVRSLPRIRAMAGLIWMSVRSRLILR